MVGTYLLDNGLSMAEIKDQSIHECPFCDLEIHERIIGKKGTVYAVADRYSVTSGHVLVVPFRHSSDFFTMTRKEKQDMVDLIDDLRNDLLQKDASISGFNIGTNCGRVAGQTIMHAHMHVIPRREGDSKDPLGGVRCVIPSKKAYKSAETKR